jgi:hypothetical protein
MHGLLSQTIPHRVPCRSVGSSLSGTRRFVVVDHVKSSLSDDDDDNRDLVGLAFRSQSEH